MSKSLLLKISALMAFALGLSACREEIMHNLAEPQANALVTRLSEINIEAQKEAEPGGSWMIAVKSSQTMEALRFLEQSKLLHSNAEVLPSSSAGVLSSKEDQRLRYERALSHEIEGTLASLAGVLQARVHLNLPELDPIFGQALNKEFKSSASVLLVSDRDLTQTKEEIAQLVSGAAGIPADQIRVLLNQQQTAAFAAPLLAQYQTTATPFSRTTILSLAIFFGLSGVVALSWYFISFGRLR